MNKFICLVALLTFITFFYGYVRAQDAEEPVEPIVFSIESQKYQTSIYALAARPEKYDGKVVFLTGYVKFHFGFFIYPDRTSCEDSFHVNSLSISIDQERYQKYASKIGKCQIMSISGVYQRLNEYGRDKIAKLSIGEIVNFEGIYEY